MFIPALSKKKISPQTKSILLLVNIIGIFVFLLVAVVFLIGVYHTTIFLIAQALAPIFLFVIPTVTLSAAAGVIFFKQPVHSLLCLITVFFTTVLLYLYTGAEFLAFLFLIVYVGAIAILFLFVIMLLHLKKLTSLPRITTSGIGLIFVPSVLLVCVGVDDLLSQALIHFFVSTDVTIFKTVLISSDALVWFVNNKFTDILTFSSLLYTYHCFLFFMASLLLLTAMLGAIILATSATDTQENPITLRF